MAASLLGSVPSPLAIAATVDAALEEDAEATAAVTSASDDGDDVDADAVATVTSGSKEEDDVDGPLEDAEAVATAIASAFATSLDAARCGNAAANGHFASFFSCSDCTIKFQTKQRIVCMDATDWHATRNSGDRQFTICVRSHTLKFR